MTWSIFRTAQLLVGRKMFRTPVFGAGSPFILYYPLVCIVRPVQSALRPTHHALVAPQASPGSKYSQARRSL